MTRPIVYRGRFLFLDINQHYNLFHLNLPKHLYAGHQHKSSAYLDLSLCEISRPPVETSRRRITRCRVYSRDGNIDSLNLDSDRRVIDSFVKSCHKKIFNSFEIYLDEFRNFLVDHILDYIQDSRNLVGKVRNHLTILRTIILSETDSDSRLDLIKRLMKVLMEHCKDSHLVVYVVTSLPSTYEFLMFLGKIKRPELMECVMHHCQKARFDFWGVLSNLIVNYPQGYPRLFGSSFQKQEVLRILLKYGVSIETAACVFFCGQHYAWLHERLRRLASETDEWTDRRETLRHILLCSFSIYKERELSMEQVQESIRMIWDYLPDAYHSAIELEEYEMRQQVHLSVDNSFRMRDNQNQSLREMCKWYIDNIAVETSGTLQPRSLKQLCRVAIRKKLAQNFQLPEGIATLGLPPSVQKYLRLDGKFFYLTFFNSRIFLQLRDAS